jgi:flagellar hook assembly protein FlgD
MNIQGIPSLGTALAPSATNSATSDNTTTPSPTQDANDAEQTFIKLLVTELQSQDPTSPMDPTTMVGQMFQMNQLQQLIDINQTLSTALTAPATSASSASSSTVPTTTGTALSQAATLPTQAAAASYAQQLMTGVN